MLAHDNFGMREGVTTFSQIHRFLYSILKNMYCLGLLYDFPLIYLAKFQFKLYYFPF